MEIWLPELTSSSTRGSQIATGTSRLRGLQERLQSRARENSAREERPPTRRDHPVRSVIIASYKRNADGAYPRHNRMDWTEAQGARRDATLLGLKFRAAQDTRGCNPLDYRGQPDMSVDATPGALAGWSFEFFWCCNTPDVGVTRDAGDGEDVHDHADDGNQWRVQRRVEESNAAAGEDELYS